MGFLDRLFGRRGRGSGAPAPTRDDTLSSTYVPPPIPDVHPGAPDDRDDDDRDDDGQGDDGGDDGGDSGGGDGGGGDGGDGGGD
jgi:hypothetical protein